MARNLLDPDLDTLDEISDHYQELAETNIFEYDDSGWFPHYLRSLGYYVDDPDEDEEDESDFADAEESDFPTVKVSRRNRARDKKLHEEKLRRIARQNGNRNGPREKKRCVVPVNRKLSNVKKWRKQYSNRKLRCDRSDVCLCDEEE